MWDLIVDDAKSFKASYIFYFDINHKRGGRFVHYCMYTYVEEYRFRNYIKLSLVLKNVRYNELWATYILINRSS